MNSGHPTGAGADAEFIASMEEILDTYEEPYDADYPVLCMDEQPVQFHKETRKPIPAKKNHARRVDWQFKVKDARKKLKSLYPKIII